MLSRKLPDLMSSLRIVRLEFIGIAVGSPILEVWTVRTLVCSHTAEMAQREH